MAYDLVQFGAAHLFSLKGALHTGPFQNMESEASGRQYLDSQRLAPGMNTSRAFNELTLAGKDSGA
jgi:hypothetical protein